MRQIREEDMMWREQNWVNREERTNKGKNGCIKEERMNKVWNLVHKGEEDSKGTELDNRQKEKMNKVNKGKEEGTKAQNTHFEDGTQFRHIDTLSVQQLLQDVASLGPGCFTVTRPVRWVTTVPKLANNNGHWNAAITLLRDSNTPLLANLLVSPLGTCYKIQSLWEWAKN